MKISEVEANEEDFSVGKRNKDKVKLSRKLYTENRKQVTGILGVWFDLVSRASAYFRQKMLGVSQQKSVA